jgi:DNA-binding response OmpR family regulator
MEAQTTLLCIHRDPDQLLHLKENGYRLLTATSGSEGLRLLMSHAVDAVVMEYHLGLLDGVIVASEIKHVKPQLPIVMVCDNLELAGDAMKSVDAVVVKTDGHHFLLATIHFVLSMDWDQRHVSGSRSRATGKHFNRMGLGRPRRSGTLRAHRSSTTEDRDTPFSVSLWTSILNGTIPF